MLDLSISIVNWNAEDMLNRCLNSIVENVKGIAYEVIVIDNNSQDGSVKMVRSSFPQLNLIENNSNLGFAKGNNQAYRMAKGRNFLLLNPDTVVTPNSLEKMVEFLDNNDKAGAVCARLLNPDGSFQNYYARFPTFWTMVLLWTIPNRFFKNSKIIRGYLMKDDDFNRVRTIEQPPASCLMIKTELFKGEDLMDKSFPILFNDVDLCRRIYDRGYEIYLIPEAGIIHEKGHDLKRMGERWIEEYFINMFTYFRKYEGTGQALGLKVIFSLDFLLRIWYQTILVMIGKRPYKELRDMASRYYRIIRENKLLTY